MKKISLLLFGFLVITTVVVPVGVTSAASSTEASKSDIQTIRDYYKALSKRQFSEACLLKSNQKDCVANLGKTYKDILIAIPYGLQKNGSGVIAYEVYYEDKATLRSSIYEVKKMLKGWKIVDVSSKSKSSITPKEFTLSNKNMVIYRNSFYDMKTSYVFFSVPLSPKSPICETDDALKNGWEIYNSNRCQGNAFPPEFGGAAYIDDNGNMTKRNVKRREYLKKLYNKAAQLYKNKSFSYYTIYDTAKLIWKRDSGVYTNKTIDSLFVEYLSQSQIGLTVYSIDNILWYKKNSQAFIQDYATYDMSTSYPLAAWQKYLLFHTSCSTGMLQQYACSDLSSKDIIVN